MFQSSIAVYAADILFHIEKRGNPDFYQAMKEGKIGDDNVNEPFVRGIGRIYDVNQKKNVYIKGKRMEDMDAASCTYFSFKRSIGILDWEEYERRKTLAVAKLNEAFEKEATEPKLTGKALKILEFKQKAYYYIKVKCGKTVSEIERYFEEDQGAVSRYIGNEQARLEKIRLEYVHKPEPAIESEPDPDEEPSEDEEEDDDN